MCSNKKSISSHQVHRFLGISYMSACFLSHRIRECMRSGEFAPVGSVGGTVEVAEIFVGNHRTNRPQGEKKGRGYYPADFDFPYNTRLANGVDDGKRGEVALLGLVVRRLTYRRADTQPES